MKPTRKVLTASVAISCATKGLLLATSLTCLTLAAPTSAIGQEVLPFPPKPSGSVANRTMQESVYKPRATPRRLPQARDDLGCQ